MTQKCFFLQKHNNNNIENYKATQHNLQKKCLYWCSFFIGRKKMKEHQDLTSLITDYWNGRAKDFSLFRKDEYHSVQYDKWEAELKTKLTANHPANAKILDVGCGSGFLSAILTRLGYNVMGIDISEEMIEQAKAFAAAENLDIDFYLMNALELQFPTANFDYVLSRNLTWTLPDIEQAYKEWLRVLKPGGLLINFDAEYAKDFSTERYAKHAAHVDCSEEQNRQCAKIYDMLEVSSVDRPTYDAEILERLGINFTIDETVSQRIYDDPSSRYYIPCNMFCIIGKKQIIR